MEVGDIVCPASTRSCGIYTLMRGEVEKVSKCYAAVRWLPPERDFRWYWRGAHRSSQGYVGRLTRHSHDNLMLIERKLGPW